MKAPAVVQPDRRARVKQPAAARTQALPAAAAVMRVTAGVALDAKKSYAEHAGLMVPARRAQWAANLAHGVAPVHRAASGDRTSQYKRKHSGQTVIFRREGSGRSCLAPQNVVSSERSVSARCSTFTAITPHLCASTGHVPLQVQPGPHRSREQTCGLGQERSEAGCPFCP